MMKKTVVALAALTIGIAGAALAQDVDPVGIWDWDIDFQGQFITGSFEISGETDAWTGTATADGQGTTDILSVEVDGDIIVLTVDTGGQGAAIIEMVVTGDEFEGVGSLEGMGEFAIAGSRRSG